MIRIKIFALIIGIALSTSAFSQTKETVDGIAHKLACQCGTCPNLALYSCYCGTAERMRTEIGELIGKGLDSDAVVESFVEKYGEQVLAAPRKEGFYLTAWVMPILAVMAFGVLIVITLRRWSQKTAAVAEITPKNLETDGGDYAKRLDKELKDS